MAEDRVEDLLREDLRRRALGVDVAAPVVDRARTTRRRRRTTRWAVAGAFVVVLAVTAGGSLLRGDAPPAPADRADAPHLSTSGAGWRTEAWHGLTVRVPTDWGFGGGPQAGPGPAVACAPGAVVGPRGEPLTASDRGWVGRAVSLTDVCSVLDGAGDAPFVLLGSTLPVGVAELAGGVVQETVEVAGERLTVATDDARLREAIVGSVGTSLPVGCGARIAERPSPAVISEPFPPAVCAYVRDRSGWDLVYTADLSDDVADAATREYQESQAFPFRTAFCAGRSIWSGQVVYLALGNASYVLGQTGGCLTVLGPEGHRVAFDEVLDLVDDNGLRGVLPALIGPQG